MVWRWLFSSTVRQAWELFRRASTLLNEQRDLLSAEAVHSFARARDHLGAALRNGASNAEIETRMSQLAASAENMLLPHPRPAARENIKDLLVAAVVILGITTFFLQLTRIPTNSLLPTLYGVTERDLRSEPDFVMPGRLSRFAQYWFSGVSHIELVARTTGSLNEIEPARLVFPFVKRQRFRIGDEWHAVWFPPDELERRAKLHYGRQYRAGEPVIRLRVVSGDHLLVDRFTYNFRRPKRGEIVVFRTDDIAGLDGQQLYIKRLVGLPGERVRIGDDQHAYINGARLDSATPRFENVYSFPPVPREGEYFGHVNRKTALRHGGSPDLAPLFPDGKEDFLLSDQEYLVLGDNTLNSRDSRAWGGLPRKNVIGKNCFVYWPFSERFGWSVR